MVGVVFGLSMDKFKSDVMIYWMVFEDKDKLGIYIMFGGWYIGVFVEEYEKVNKLMLIIINIGLDLVIMIGVIFELLIMLFGYNELGVVGVIWN